MVSIRSPAWTGWPTATATLAITPGIGAATWPGLPASAFGRFGAIALALRFGTRTARGWPFSSKNTRTSPSALVSPTACSRTSMVLPGSISAEISWPGSMP